MWKFMAMTILGNLRRTPACTPDLGRHQRSRLYNALHSENLCFQSLSQSFQSKVLQTQPSTTNINKSLCPNMMLPMGFAQTSHSHLRRFCFSGNIWPRQDILGWQNWRNGVMLLDATEQKLGCHSESTRQLLTTNNPSKCSVLCS